MADILDKQDFEVISSKYSIESYGIAIELMCQIIMLALATEYLMWKSKLSYQIWDTDLDTIQPRSTRLNVIKKISIPFLQSIRIF